MDAALTQTLNGLIGRSVAFDIFLDFLQDSYFTKGLFAVVVLVMVYTARSSDPRTRQTNVYTTLVLVFIALFLARVMQMILPFSPRPLYSPGLDLTLVDALESDVLAHDSSFPSDHAVMFMTIATSVLLYARGAGAILLMQALFIISLPRIILGFHWPSDIVAGLAIGAGIALALHRPVYRALLRSRLSQVQADHPSLFYGALTIILAETSTMYQGSRHLLSTAAEFAARVF